jgi:formyl-CoA transferase
MNERDASGALAGVRIVEACEGVGGPMAAMLLAEQGADVIKVEPPAGDRLRGQAAFHVLNRSKRSVTLDLEMDDGRRSLRDLVRDADVFLHDWPHGRDAELGFDAVSLHADNPALIIGWLPAYGSRGPWAQLPPDEALVQAVSGAQAAQWRYDPRPVYINIPIAGYAQGIVGAASVAAALYARSQTGSGESFELSAVASIFQFETTAFVRSANVQRLAGQSDPRGPIPTYRLVQASDGWLFIGALTPAFWTKLAVACGLDDLLVDQRFAGAPIAIPNMDDRKELAARLDAAFLTKRRDEWMRILEEADVPRSLVFTREEWRNDAQLNHNGMVVEVDDPVLGGTTQMGVPVRLHGAPGHIVGPARTLGADNASLRAPGRGWKLEAGSWSVQPPTSNLQPRAHPLQGIRVLDLGTFIAGASCSMMLTSGRT